MYVNLSVCLHNIFRTIDVTMKKKKNEQKKLTNVPASSVKIFVAKPNLTSNDFFFVLPPTDSSYRGYAEHYTYLFARGAFCARVALLACPIVTYKCIIYTSMYLPIRFVEKGSYWRQRVCGERTSPSDRGHRHQPHNRTDRTCQTNQRADRRHRDTRRTLQSKIE